MVVVLLILWVVRASSAIGCSWCSRLKQFKRTTVTAASHQKGDRTDQLLFGSVNILQVQSRCLGPELHPSFELFHVFHCFPLRTCKVPYGSMQNDSFDATFDSKWSFIKFTKAMASRPRMVCPFALEFLRRLARNDSLGPDRKNTLKQHSLVMPRDKE